MKRLLTTESKRAIKAAYKANAVFRVIDAAYKELERQKPTFHFSPEEIFLNCFVGFDKMLKNRDEIEETTRRMWDDIYCELSDDAEDASRDFETEELETATSCILYSIVACLEVSDEWELNRHSYSLMNQIAEHSRLADISPSFNDNLGDDFIWYVRRYVRGGKYISDRLESPRSYADPINPIGTPQERTKAKEGVKKRLEFMKGYLPDGETQIMTSSSFNTMIEAVEYLMENNVVRKQESKIHTNMKSAYLRYTFYLVYKNEGKCVGRQLWLDFLGETFSQMQDNQASLSKHFSDEPDGYDLFLKPKRKK